MSVLLSDEELQALEGLPHLHRCLYIFGIRRYMDYATGITGIKRKISYQSLNEEVYIEPKQGLKTRDATSKDKVKRALKVLESARLITIHSIVTKEKKQLILKCELAMTDKFAQNKAAALPPHSPALQAASVDNSGNTINIDTLSEDENKSRLESRPTQEKKAAAHPLSGKDTKLNYTVEPVDNFLSHDENKFMNLFTDMKLSLRLAGDLKAITTAKALVSAGVSLEVASEALKIKLAAYQGDRTPHPSYFKDAIINYKHDLDAINNQKEGINDAITRTAKSGSNQSVRERLAKWSQKREQEEQARLENDSAIIR